MLDKELKFGELAAKVKPGDEEWYFNVEPLLYDGARITLTDGHWVEAFWDYESKGDAILALNTWDGTGDPPGPWVRAQREGENEFVRRPKGEKK